ncbi:hypothetical protein AGMMS49965_05520 [Bacteroidia bacterium]|nr:hypothetical protein AGMMS49965_05520 [Bacteroidia bacterium]
MTINGTTVSSTDVYGKDGYGTALSSFQSQAWIVDNLTWDFSTVWKMSSSGSANQGLPIFKNSQEQTQTYTITVTAGTGISATTGAGTYNSGTTATVGCTVTSDYTFDGWYEGSTKVSSSQSYSFTVNSARTLEARATQNASTQYTITTQPGDIGISSTTGAGTYNSGATATVGCTVQSDYTFDGWYEGSTKVSSSQFYSFIVTEARTLEARATQNAPEQYTITASASSGGTISPSDNVNISQGGSQMFYFTPATGYEINQVLVDGVNNVSAVASGSYTFANVTANRSISVTFRQKQYTITVSAGANGSISPASHQTVDYGDSRTFTFTPNAGYEINQVQVDGVNDASAVANGTYTFTNVTANRSISVTFRQKQYTITVSAGANGSISPASHQTVDYGDSRTFTFTPIAGYEINQVLVDDVNNASAVTNGTYTFPNVTTNHTIAVTFRQKQYTITVSAGANGSISPASHQTVNHGDSRTFTFTPNAGYEINQVQVDGTNNASAIANGTYTFANVTANHTIAVTFKQKQYTITVSAGANGSISPASHQTVNHGDSRTFTFTPNAGYEINQVQVDGVNDAAAISSGSHTFESVTAHHTLAIAFGKTCLPNLVVQIWDDVLSLVNDTERTGYTFVAYQWLKNDEWLAGETSAYLYFPEAAKDYNAEYTLLLTTTTGQELQTCPVRLRAVKADLRAYPNPTTGTVTVEDATIQAGTKIDIYNINGQLVKQCEAAQDRTTVDISSLPRGTYILRVNNRQGKIIKN